MEMMPRETIEMSVVLYPEDGHWIAQGLEFDITARVKRQLMRLSNSI